MVRAQMGVHALPSRKKSVQLCSYISKFLGLNEGCCVLLIWVCSEDAQWSNLGFVARWLSSFYDDYGLLPIEERSTLMY